MLEMVNDEEGMRSTWTSMESEKTTLEKEAVDDWCLGIHLFSLLCLINSRLLHKCTFLRVGWNKGKLLWVSMVFACKFFHGRKSKITKESSLEGERVC